MKIFGNVRYIKFTIWSYNRSNKSLIEKNPAKGSD